MINFEPGQIYKTTSSFYYQKFFDLNKGKGKGEITYVNYKGEEIIVMFLKTIKELNFDHELEKFSYNYCQLFLYEKRVIFNYFLLKEADKFIKIEDV